MQLPKKWNTFLGDFILCSLFSLLGVVNLFSGFFSILLLIICEDFNEFVDLLLVTSNSVKQQFDFKNDNV